MKVDIRSAIFQKVLAKAAQWDLSQKAAEKIRARHTAPVVQKPGVGRGPREAGADAATATMRRLEKTGKLRDAVAALQAQRAQRRR
jgi:hypothetical protein